MNGGLQTLTIADAAKLIHARQLSPVELTEAQLRAIDTFDPQLNAFITVTAELALGQAKRAEQEIVSGNYRGPLHGIPVGIKDIYNTSGILTSAGSRLCAGNIPSVDAAAVTKLYAAGAVLLGKLATHEFAHGGPSFDLPWKPARNPWRLEHFTGGSSSGSGAAVAAGLVLGALGSDTGGSIRGPASFCGTVGVLPTYGLVSRAGVIPNSFTFDRCGPLTWTVEDAALMLQAIAGYDAADPGSVEHPTPDYRAALTAGIKGIRIGVLRHFWEQDLIVDESLRNAMEEAIRTLRGLGAIVETCHTRPLADSHDVKVVIAEAELFSIHYRDLVARPGEFGRDFLGRVLPACLFQAADYVEALRERRRVMAAMRPLYKKYDVLLTAAFGPAPRLDQYRTVSFWQRPNILTHANVTGGPALAQCIGFSPHGLPLGMQILGRPWDDATVLRVGHAYEHATAWRSRRPVLDPAATQPTVIPMNNDPVPADPEAEISHIAMRAAQCAGLKLDDRHMALLLEGAPYALSMAQRIRKSGDRMEMPAFAFGSASAG